MCKRRSSIVSVEMCAPLVRARDRDERRPREYSIGGHARNRTGVQGFAVLCVTTPPRGRSKCVRQKTHTPERPAYIGAKANRQLAGLACLLAVLAAQKPAFGELWRGSR